MTKSGIPKANNSNELSSGVSSYSSTQRSYDSLISILSDPVSKQLTYERLRWIEIGIRSNERTSEQLFEAGLSDQANKLYLCRNSLDLVSIQGIPQTIAYDHCNLTHYCQFCAWRRGNRLYRNYNPACSRMLSEGYEAKWLTVNARFTKNVYRHDLISLWKDYRTLMRRKVMKPIKGSLSFMEVEATDSGWLPHIHSILFSKSEIKQEDLTESWSSVNPDPNAVHIITADPSDLRIMILYGCKHQKFTSTVQIASFFGATAGFRMASSSGTILRRVSAEANRTRKSKNPTQIKNSEYQSRRQKIVSNISPRSREFYELLWMTSPDFAKFAYIV